MKGTVPTAASLPMTGNAPNDTYTALDTGHAWTWTGSAWIDIGLIQGPAGPVGPAGPTGAPGAPGATGVRGSLWYTGSGAPASPPSGSLPGDLYLDLVSGDVYTVS